MARKRPPRPTEAELNILRVLWDRGPSTVREVWEAIRGDRITAYTTVLKQFQVMTEKELVVVDKSRRSHVYRAAVTEKKTLRRLVGNLVEAGFGGSAHKLILEALSHYKASPDELEDIRKLIDDLEKKR